MNIMSKYEIKFYDFEEEEDSSEVVEALCEVDAVQALTEGLGDGWEDLIQVDSVDRIGFVDSDSIY
jgi:hypothetical protein